MITNFYSALEFFEYLFVDYNIKCMIDKKKYLGFIRLNFYLHRKHAPLFTFRSHVNDETREAFSLTSHCNISSITKVVYDLIGFIVAYYQSIYALSFGVLSLAWWNHAIGSVVMKITVTPHERHGISDHQQTNCLFSISFSPITKI